jgi:hypothetical protein
MKNGRCADSEEDGCLPPAQGMVADSPQRSEDYERTARSASGRTFSADKGGGAHISTTLDEPSCLPDLRYGTGRSKKNSDLGIDVQKSFNK